MGERIITYMAMFGMAILFSPVILAGLGMLYVLFSLFFYGVEETHKTFF